MEEKTCCVTGHRDIPDDQVERVKEGLRREIERAIKDGYTRFISGFAEGADLYFAEIVAEKRGKNPALRLEAAIPYRNRLLKLQKDGHTRAPLEACTEIGVVSEKYTSSVHMKRNRFMVKSLCLPKRLPALKSVCPIWMRSFYGIRKWSRTQKVWSRITR